jgi:uncharacterized membrane protein YkvA (DUF1232 family)
MQLPRIRKQIRQALAHDAKTGTVAQLYCQACRVSGREPTQADVEGAVTFVRQYVEHAPAILEALQTAASEAGVIQQVMPILEAAENYFLQPMDFIPDQLGLVGLTDDAYVVHVLVQKAAGQYEQQTGHRLLPLQMDFSQANAMMRTLIGEPVATQLDMAVAQTFVAPQLQDVIRQWSQWNAALPLGPDPIWGNASINDIVNTKMALVTSSYSPSF